VSCGLDVPDVLPAVLDMADRGELRAGPTTVTAREVQMGDNAFLQNPLLYPKLAGALAAALRQDGTALHATGMHADPAAYRMYRSIICQDIGAHDVATPRAWAENTRRQLPDSMLLRWQGAGHSAWQINNRCATDATVAYLVTRELPPEGTVC
jgi:hypothetical protein